MDRDSRDRRAYTVSKLPTMQDAAPPAGADDFRIALYGRVCETWRALVDVRFKLLALVPVVSVLGISKVLEVGKEPSLSQIARTGIAVVGLLATLGLLVYELRNSELHDDLISRGRRIEDELKVDNGLFRGRLYSANWFVKHDRAIALIYGASFLGWGFAIAAIWAGW